MYANIKGEELNSLMYALYSFFTNIGSRSVSLTILGESNCAKANPMGLPSEANMVQNARSLGPNQRAASFVGE